MKPKDACEVLLREVLGKDADNLLGDRLFLYVREFIEELCLCTDEWVENYRDLLVRDEELKILSEEQYDHILFLLRSPPG